MQSAVLVAIVRTFGIGAWHFNTSWPFSIEGAIGVSAPISKNPAYVGVH